MIATIPHCIQSKIPGVHIGLLEFHADERGSVAEVFRMDSDILWTRKKPEMGYVSFTNPGVSRGPHEHYEQADYFVFLGPAEFEIHLWDRRVPHAQSIATHEQFVLGGSAPALLYIPPLVVHGYRNISVVIGISFNFPDALYKGWIKSDDIDEFRWEIKPDNPYKF